MKLRLSESFDFGGPTKDRHDPEKGVVRGVKVLGLGSRNGREYTRQAVREAFDKKLYHGRAVYLNHPAGKSNARDIQDRFARLREVRVDDKGELYADLHYNPKHAFAPTFAYLVENDPDGIGLSQNAEGTGRKRAGKTTLVESIDVVHSVDLVDGPATTMGLFEQEGATMDMGGADPAAGTGDTGGGMNWRAQLAELVKTITADESMTPDAIKTKLMAALKLLDEEAGEGDGEKKEGDAEPAEPPTEDEMMEQLRNFASPAVRKAVRKLDEIRVREQAKRAGLPESALTPVFVGLLREKAADPKKVGELIDDRKATLREQDGKGGTKPKSAPRDPVKVREQDGKGGTDGKSTKDLAGHYFADVPDTPI